MTEPSEQHRIVTTFAWDEPLEDLYASWQEDVRLAEHAHRVLGRRLSIRSTVVGVVAIAAAGCAGAIALAPVVAADAYARATAGIDPDVFSIVAASLAGIAAVLTAALAIARSGVMSERHRAAASRYRSLDRAMTAVIVTRRDARPSPDAALTWVRERLTRYERESPVIARRRWARLEASFRGADARPEPASAPQTVHDTRSLAAT